MASLHRLVDTYEADSKDPVSLKRMSPRTLRQIKGVVGFQIVITDIQAKYKLSQNRHEDHSKIIEELRKREDSGSKATAEAMQQSNF